MSPPLVILGAPRSGTNMLRDLLTSLRGVHTWPCDEIDPVWRHGNLGAEHDEFGRERATAQVRQYVRRTFERMGRGHQLLVEKTCANSLRVGFVDEILPEAHFVVLLRDGRDAAPSALHRWKGRTNFVYTIRKARFVPPTDFPRYLARWVKQRLRRVVTGEDALSVWGPRFEGMLRFRQEHGVAATCGRQWTRCVQRTHEEITTLSPDRWIALRYEHLVESPQEELRRILDFAGLTDLGIPDVSEVRSGLVGRGIDRVSPSEWAEMEPELEPGLRLLESWCPV